MTVNAEDPQWAVKRDAAIVAWRKAKSVLEAAKESEMDLRKQVTQMLFPNPVKGTQRFPLGEGYAVKLVHKINYKLGDATLTDKKTGAKVKIADQVENVMAAIEKCGNEGAFLVDRLIKTQYDLSVSEYNLLDEGSQVKKLIDSILITSDASPTLELEAPK